MSDTAKDAVLENATSDDIENLSDSLNLVIEEPDDVPEATKRTASDKAKDFVKTFVKKDTEETPTTKGRKPRQPRTPSKSKFFSRNTAIVTIMVTGLVGMALPDYWKTPFTYQVGDKVMTSQLAPTKEQVDAVVSPLMRVLDRHVKISEASEDADDIATAILGIIAYGLDLQANFVILNLIREQEKQNHAKEQATPFVNRATGVGPTI